MDDNKSGVKKKSSKGKKSKAKSAKKATQSKSVAKESPIVSKKSSKKADLLRDKVPKKKFKVKGSINKKTENGEVALGDQKSGVVSSEIIKKVTSSQSEESTTLEKSYNEDALFLSGEHKSNVENVVSCLKSSTPFCFLSSEKKSYIEYYKEVIIDLLRYREKIKLLYFDPKFGDDLSVIINRELEDIDMSFIGSSKMSDVKKILIIDNEDFSGHLDWELMDSLRLELSSANIGVLSIKPNFLVAEVESKVAPITSKFSCFYFPELTKSELKELNEYISAHSEKDQLLEIVEKLFADNTEKGGNMPSDDEVSIWRKARKFILRK